MRTQMLTVESAAAALSVHPETVRRMIKRGEIAAAKVGRHWRVPESAIAQIEAQANQTTDAARVENAV